MSTATTMRLVPAAMAESAGDYLSAVSIATVVAAPLGSYFGALIGWRNVFLICALPSVVALLWQLWVLPSMRRRASAASLPCLRCCVGQV